MKNTDQQPQWFFHQHEIGEPECTPLTDEFFKNGTRLESVIREGVQNAIDARADQKMPVRVRIYCSGKEKALSAKSYAKYRRGAEARYADERNGLVNPPSETEGCVYLVLEDFNTTGLTGDVAYRPERDETDRAKCNYYNYFFKVNDTSSTGKNTGDTLGSWGTGKATFTRASRLKTSFALTVRGEGEPHVFLAGKATLQVHTDDQQITWDPDGWYGCVVSIDEHDPLRARAIPKRPVVRTEEKDPVAQFVKDFNLARRDETGTSIVIPHLVIEQEEESRAQSGYSTENLARAVIQNFLAAILDGSLEVNVSSGAEKEPLTIDAKTIGKYTKLLPDIADTDRAVTRTHATLIREMVCNEMPKTRVFELKQTGMGRCPEWGDVARFRGLNLPALKQTLRDGKSLLFRVPLSVLKKSEEQSKKVKTAEDDVFQVIISKANLGRPVKPIFYRLGLLIDSVSVQAIPNYAAVVLIGHGPLAKLLVASEPPSHSEWSKDADKVKKGWYTVQDHILFVTAAARAILEAIENSDQEANWDPLADAFGIPDDTGDKDGKKPGKNPKDDSEPTTAGGSDVQGGEGGGASGGGGGGGGGGDPVPAPILTIEKIDESGRRGFAISVNPERVLEQGYPCSTTYRFGFAPFNDTGWSKYDFQLDDAKSISITVDPPAAKDSVISVTPLENKLTVTLFKPGAARIEVTGFEQDRDLEWKKSGYVYGKEAE